jgi:hypothetical protein
MFRFEIKNTTSVYERDNVSRILVLDGQEQLVGSATIVYQNFNDFEWHLKDLNIQINENSAKIADELMSGVMESHRHNNGDGLWTEVRSQGMKDFLTKWNWDDCEEPFTDDKGQRVDIYVLLSTPFDR